MNSITNSTHKYKTIYNRYVIFYKQYGVYDVIENKWIQPNDSHTITLIDSNKKTKKMPYKKLYKQLFDEEYSYDDICDLDGEVWRKIALDKKNRYYISNYGRAKSYCYYKANLLQNQPNSKGYERIRINGDYYFIHHLVLNTFSCNMIKPCGYEIDHIDNNIKNNKLNNLQYLTIEANRQKMIEHKNELKRAKEL